MIGIRLVRSILAATFLILAGAGQAQDLPHKNLRFIVPFLPGGPADISARTVAVALGNMLGQSVLVENKPGAGSVVAVQALKAAPPDGRTLMMASNTFATARWLYKNAPFDPLNDARAVIGVSKSPHIVLVSSTFSGASIVDLIRMAKENPGRVNYASAGAGSMPHLGTELFKKRTGTQMTHVPYKGSGDAIPAVMGGQVDVYFEVLLAAQGAVKSNKVKALGMTSLNRIQAYPDVPTLDEQGLKGFELYSWFGLIALRETSDAVTAQLNAAINKVMAMATVSERIASLGAIPVGGPPQVFQKMIETDYETWGGVIRSLDIKLD